MKFSEYSIDQLTELNASLADQYESIKAENLKLDLTRGKPAADQLDLSNELDGILGGFYLLQDGTDVRNYGGLLGLPEARQLGSEILEISAEETMVGGNSSLTLMYEYISFMMNRYWLPEATNSKIKFLCPVPGYDRHFTICEHFDIEMINVPFDESGPDMDEIESMLNADPMIKGIWCVPKYSNPTGLTYAKPTVQRLSKLAGLAGKNFRVMWDNAYAVHHLADKYDALANIMREAKKTKHQDNIAMFASTSKVTFAGAGISFIGLSEQNISAFEKHISASSIGPDKVNQLRHVRFLKNSEGIRDHMLKLSLIHI